jgi:hypothetical protein
MASAAQAVLAPRDEAEIATSIMLAEATGKDRATTSHALKHRYAPPSAMTGLGPIYNRDDGIRYLTHTRQGQTIVPPEQYELNRADVEPYFTRTELADFARAHLSVQEVADRLDPAVRNQLLAELRRPWASPPPGPSQKGGFMSLKDAAALAPRSATTTNTRLGDPEWLSKYGIRVFQARNTRLFFPAENVLACLREVRPRGGDWQATREPYVPPARSGRRPPVRRTGRRGGR